MSSLLERSLALDDERSWQLKKEEEQNINKFNYLTVTLWVNWVSLTAWTIKTLNNSENNRDSYSLWIHSKTAQRSMTLHMINSILRVTVQYKAAMFTVNSSSISRRVHLLWGKPNLQDCVLRSVFDGGIPPSRLRGESAEIGLQSRYQSHLRTPMLGFRGETWMLPGKEMNRKVWHRDRTVKLRSRGIGNEEGTEDLPLWFELV